MQKLILKVAVFAAALWVTIWLIPGLEYTGRFWPFIGIALIFAIVNTTLRPIVKLLSLPFIILTLGIGAIIINALMFWLVVWISGPSNLDLGLTSTGFWASLLGAIVMGLVSFVLNRFIKPDKRR